MDAILSQLLDDSLPLAQSVSVIQKSLNSTEPRVTSTGVVTALRRGRISSEKEVSDINLQVPSEDLAFLLIQLGQWFVRAPHEPIVQKKRQMAILQLIDAYPTCEAHEYPECWLYASFDRDAYAVAKQKWLASIDKHRDNACVHSFAAHHLALHDADLAASLLERAICIDPDNPKWQDQLKRLR